MRKEISPRNYQYTYYNVVEHNVTETKPASSYLKSYQLPETSTDLNSKVPSERILGSISDPSNYPYKNPIYKYPEEPVNKI